MMMQDLWVEVVKQHLDKFPGDVSGATKVALEVIKEYEAMFPQNNAKRFIPRGPVTPTRDMEKFL